MPLDSLKTFVAGLYSELIRKSERQFLWSEAELLLELSRPDVWALFVYSESEFSFFSGSHFEVETEAGRLRALKSFVLFRKSDRSVFDLMFVASVEPEAGWAVKALNRSILEIQKKEASQSIQILLEVRESNRRAVEFYRKFGFRQIAVRKDYYPAFEAFVPGKKNPREDALVMSYRLGEEEVKN